MLRSVRLRALEEAPDAFGSTLERELARTDDDWSRWIEPNPTFLLEAPNLGAQGAVGMVAGAMDALDPTAAVLLAMWVDPAFRRTGGSDLLVQAVVEWAREVHVTKVSLCVIAGNDSAIRLYERCGFARTGQQRIRERDACAELAMQRIL
jgi:GNAT superfamily N-acetyltransferase